MLSRFQNAGQSCIAAKRLLLHHSIKDDFLDRLIAAMKILSCGDPMDSATFIGPLARKSCVERIQEQVNEGLLLVQRLCFSLI